MGVGRGVYGGRHRRLQAVLVRRIMVSVALALRFTVMLI